jgi:hypothetical protein
MILQEAIDVAREELLALGEVQPATLAVLDETLSSFCSVMQCAGVVYVPTLPGIAQLELDIFDISRGRGISEMQFYQQERRRLQSRLARATRYLRPAPRPLVLRVEALP